MSEKIHDPRNATLTDRVDVHESLAIFRVSLDAAPILDFAPGQFTTLGLADPDAEPRANSPRTRRTSGTGHTPKMIRRAYSIASPATEKHYLEFYLVHIEEGRLTALLWPMNTGSRLFMDPRIKGSFTLDGVSEDSDLIMVGTGTGLAPLLSMYLTYRGTGRWRRFILLEGCRYARDLAYREQLTRMAEKDPTFTYLPTVTRESPDSPWPGLRGRVHDILRSDRFSQLTGNELSPKNCHIFLCGNPAMIDQAEARLQRQGFMVCDRENPQGNIHFERYW